MKRFLPTIIILSILGSVLVVSFTVFACHYMGARKRRKISSIERDDEEPVRQLTVRNGKVVPISEIVPTASAKRPRSPDVRTVESEQLLKWKLWRAGVPPSTTSANVRDLRRSPPPMDLEAQSGSLARWEVSVERLRQLEEQLGKQMDRLNSQRAKNGKSTSASRRKITTGLKMGYRGTPILETVTVEIPSAPGSKAATIRTLDRKKIRNNSTAQSPTPRITPSRLPDVTLTEEPGQETCTARSDSRDLPADAIGIAISTDSIREYPHVFLDNRHASVPRLPVMPNDWLGTFGSSDLSSTWTFASAQLGPILPCVTPPAAALIAAERPRSKYGRYPTRRHEKALPIPPNPP